MPHSRSFLSRFTPSRSSDLPASWTAACARCSRIYHEGKWIHPDSHKSRNAVLTHDICPDCIRILYPNYAHIADIL